MPYLFFYASAFWGIWSFGGFDNSVLELWNFSWLLPPLTPLFVIGGRRWNDDRQQNPLSNDPTDTSL
ncbi:MAG: hypothetical protein HUU54_16140 [Ignavibacteriaceae bacterium]|nr:hypothetical protein [Ignavibacteriaceae bacterium]